MTFQSFSLHTQGRIPRLSLEPFFVHLNAFLKIPPKFMYLYINTLSVFDISAVFLMFLFSMQSQAEMYCKCIQNPIFLRILLMFEYFPLFIFSPCSIRRNNHLKLFYTCVSFCFFGTLGLWKPADTLTSVS